MRAYILCGGFGTRLSSVLNGSQKAVVDIHGQPFLALVLAQLKLAGVTEAVLCAHYRADQMAALLPEMALESGVALHLVIEDQPMGTGGAVLNALRALPADDRFLVLNADTWLDQQAYRLALNAPRDVLVAVQVEDRSRYGSLSVDDQQVLLGLEEKGMTGPGRVNGGVYGFSASTLSGFAVQPCSMEKALLPNLIAARRMLVCDYSGPFVDIGTPQALQFFKSARREGERS